MRLRFFETVIRLPDSNLEGGIAPRSFNVEDFRMADEITLARGHQFNATSTWSLGSVLARAISSFSVMRLAHATRSRSSTGLSR